MLRNTRGNHITSGTKGLNEDNNADYLQQGGVVGLQGRRLNLDPRRGAEKRKRERDVR